MPAMSMFQESKIMDYAMNTWYNHFSTNCEKLVFEQFRKVKSALGHVRNVTAKYRLEVSTEEKDAQMLLDSIMQTTSEYLLVRAMRSKDPGSECNHQLKKMADQKVGAICPTVLIAANEAVRKQRG